MMLNTILIVFATVIITKISDRLISWIIDYFKRKSENVFEWRTIYYIDKRNHTPFYGFIVDSDDRGKQSRLLMIVSDDLEAYSIEVQYKKNKKLTFPIKMKFSAHPPDVIEKTGIPSIDKKSASCLLNVIQFNEILDFLSKCDYLTVILESKEEEPYICRFNMDNFNKEVKDKIDQMRAISNETENQQRTKIDPEPDP